MAILDNNTVTLLIDALEGMPFPDTERERQIQHGRAGSARQPAARQCR
jgi:hypothetical protein